MGRRTGRLDGRKDLPMSGKSGTGELAHEWAHLLKHELDLCDDAGHPVVFRIDREPAEHVRKLMQTLGVTVEVRPVSRVVNTATVTGRMLAVQDHRASIASVHKREQAGDEALTCEHCGTETDVTTVKHAPTCESYTAPVVGDPKTRPGTGPGQPTWETGRDGRRRSTRERSTMNGKDTGLSMGELARREEQMYDRTATVTSCTLAGCGWRFEGTALQCREAAAAHRATDHPDLRTSKRRQLPKPGQTGAQAHTASADGRAALDAMDTGRAVAEPDGIGGSEATGATTAAAATNASAAAGSGTDASSSGSANATRPRGKTHPWTGEEILDAIRAWAAEHGEPPKASSWAKAAHGRPTMKTVVRCFGKWSAGIEAAGFPRPAQGSHMKISGPEPLAQQPPEDLDETSISLPGDRLASPAPPIASGERGSGPDEAHPELDAPTALIVAELLRRLAAAIDTGLFRGPNLALIFDGLALETRRRTGADD